jgi:hypothetical protein
MTGKILAFLSVRARGRSVSILPAWLLLASQIAQSAPPAQAACERVAGSWSFVDHAEKNKDLSGAACAPDGGCLLVSDEDRKAWWFRIDRRDASAPRLVADKPFDLPKQGGDEADAEAAAFDQGWFYAIGSHGTSRRGNEFQKSRYAVYRIAWKDGRLGEWKASRSLSEVLSKMPGIAENFCLGRSDGPCKSLEDGGANIEGLAVRDGAMYIGFRAPAPGGRAFVVQVNVREIIEGGPVTVTPNPPPRVNLGIDRGEWGERDLGIRDMAAVSDGFLILAGPSLPEGNHESSGRVFRWAGRGEAATELCQIRIEQQGAKPEVLLKLGESKSEYRLLIIHDGVPGGAPVEYRVRKSP